MVWPSRLRYQQGDLRSLCRAPQVKPVEWYHWNDLFGFNTVIKAYAGLPASVALPWTMALQVIYDNPEVSHRRHLASSAPFLLVPTETQAKQLRQRTEKEVLAIGSAIHYMRPQYHRRHPELPLALERRGTLVFPDKSTCTSDSTFDRDGFARALAALPVEYQPVAVSIFWDDYRRGYHLPYQRAGLRLVTSGHPCDPAFLFRQYDLCLQFKYACANDISTSYCMAVLAGCRFFYWPTGPVRMRYKKVMRTFAEEPTLALPAKQTCVAASPFPPAGDGADQRVLAEQYAGAAFVRPPEFFRDLAVRGRRAVLALPPPAGELAVETALDRLAPWQPLGFHHDGSLGAAGRLVIPARPGFAAVRLTLDVPLRWSQFWRPSATVTVNAGAAVLPVWPGRWQLDIPFGPDGRPRQLGFACPGAPDTADYRGLRLAAVSWLKDHGSSLPTVTHASKAA